MMNSFGSSRPSHYSQPKPYTHLRQESSSSHMMRQDSRHSGQGTWSNRVLHPPPAPQRNHRTTPSQMRFSQPPPPSFANFNSQPGFGGSSGPGCGGGDFWAELAHFGIYPSTSASTLGTTSQAVARNTFASGKIFNFLFVFYFRTIFSLVFLFLFYANFFIIIDFFPDFPRHIFWIFFLNTNFRDYYLRDFSPQFFFFSVFLQLISILQINFCHLLFFRSSISIPSFRNFTHFFSGFRYFHASYSAFTLAFTSKQGK